MPCAQPSSSSSRGRYLSAHAICRHQRATTSSRTFQTRGGLLTGIARLVLAHRLREVRVQVGLTRLESATPALQGEYELGVEMARSACKPTGCPPQRCAEKASSSNWMSRPFSVGRGASSSHETPVDDHGK
jgi:hypothetical protein